MTSRKKLAADTSTKSSFYEQLVEHVFVSEVLQEAWYAHGQIVEVLRSEIDASGYDRPEPLNMAFNPEFFVDGLKVLEEDEVAIAFTKSNKPGKFTGGDGFVYVIMPVTLRSA